MHVALQSLPKLPHVGAHGETVPQASGQLSPPWQTHEEAVHTGPLDCDPQATKSAKIDPAHAANVTDR